MALFVISAKEGTIAIDDIYYHGVYINCFLITVQCNAETSRLNASRGEETEG